MRSTFPHINSGDVNGAAVHLVQRLSGPAHSHHRWRRSARRPEQGPEGLGDRRDDHLLPTSLGVAAYHIIKAGIKYKDVDLTAADSIPGNPVFYYDVTAAGTATIPWKAVFALPLAGFDSEVTSNVKQLGVFVQDDWTVNDHLTLNLGIRWDVEENPSYLDFVTPAVPDRFAEYGDFAGTHVCAVARPESTDPNMSLDINNYISNGNNRSKARPTRFSRDSASRTTSVAISTRDLRWRRPRLRPHACTTTCSSSRPSSRWPPRRFSSTR